MIFKRGNRWCCRLWVPDDTRPEGRRREWIGTYPTKTEAREAEAKALLDRASRPRQARQWTISEFADRWFIRYHGPGTTRTEHSTLVHNKDAVSRFLQDHGKLRLHQFDRSQARDYAAEFPWRARVVKALFADAVRDGKLTVSPFQGVSIPTGKGRRFISPLTMSEIERLAVIAEDTLGFYGPHFASFIRLAGWTGMRPGELCRIEWADIDWDAKRLTIPRTKTKQPRKIRLADPALDVLRGIARMDDFVFQTRRGRRMKGYSYAFYWTSVRAVFEAEVPRDHWLARRLRENPDDHLAAYEMRHACASLLVAEGLTVEQVAAYLGNSPAVCRSTYVHLYEDRMEEDLMAAFDRIGQRAGRDERAREAG